MESRARAGQAHRARSRPPCARNLRSVWAQALGLGSLVLGTACGSVERPNAVDGTGLDSNGTSSATSTGTTAHGTVTGPTAATSAGQTGSAQTATSSPLILDVGPASGPSSSTEQEAEPAGCDKVDLLFVIDNSVSMLDEQENLVQSFPGFIAEIQRLVAADYHIVVATTDGADSVVGGDCDRTLGAGKTKTPQGFSCDFEAKGERRFLTESQPDLLETFSCVALVGTFGNTEERPMEAALEAISTTAAPGACNQGFLRDDALLVVTIITDEEDVEKSPGDPESWHDGMVAAKGGNEQAVVALGLVGDTDIPDATCAPLGPSGDGAESAPRLQAWAESFAFGRWGSVCADDYSAFFADALSVIDGACDVLEPEG